MKRISILLFLIFYTLVYCQENAFIINNKQVVWQRIYETDKNISQIKNTLLTSGKIKFTLEENNILMGEISNFIMDYKGAGFTKMGTPMYLNENSKFNGTFKLELKENRYRVSVTNIICEGYSLSIYSGGLGISDNGKDNIETLILTNDREYFKGSFQGKPSRIVNYSFANLFDITKYNSTDDNW